MAGITLPGLVKKYGLTDKLLERECTRDHLLEIGKKIDWRVVGQNLLTKEEVDDIDIEGRNNEALKKSMMLQKWHEKWAFEATYKVLIEAMLKADKGKQAAEVCVLIAPPKQENGAGASQPSSSVPVTIVSQKDEGPNLLNIRSFKGKKETFNIIEKIGTNYTDFGIMLLQDKTGVKVAAIKQEKRDCAEDINREIIQRWLQGQGKMPVTWGTLVDVLRDIKLNVLAQDISDALGL